MNVIAWLEYKLAYNDSAVHRFNHYTIRASLFSLRWYEKMSEGIMLLLLVITPNVIRWSGCLIFFHCQNIFLGQSNPTAVLQVLYLNLEKKNKAYLVGGDAWVCSKALRGCPHGVMVKAMDCGIVVSDFILQSLYYIHFRANTLGKGMNPLILPAMA